MADPDFSDADDEDRKFMQEITKPSAKQNKGLARQKSTVSKQSAQRETGWQGNGVGSGKL